MYKKNKHGFTLIEVLITVIVVALTIMIFNGVLINVFRIRNTSSANLSVQKTAFVIFNQLTFDVRWSKSVTVNSSTSLTVINQDDSETVYLYEPTDKKITRTTDQELPLNNEFVPVEEFVITPIGTNSISASLVLSHKDNPTNTYSETQAITRRDYSIAN